MMTIDEIQDALDDYALHHYRLPLEVDPILWDVFEQDRQEAPFRGMKINFASRLPCKHCGSQMRSRTDPYRKGTVIHRGRGLCPPCYKYHKNDYPEIRDRSRVPFPDNCILCGTRQYHPKERPPGGRGHAGNGICSACVKKQRRKDGYAN